MLSDGETMWAVVNSWLTPSILFLFLNLTIGTIAVISSFATQKKQHPHPQYQHFAGADGSPPMMLARAPSLLDRVRSFDFSLYASPQHPPAVEPVPVPSSPPEAVQFQPENPSDPNGSTRLARAPSLLHRLKSFNFSFDSYQPDPSSSSHQEPAAVAGPDRPYEGDDEKVTTERESDVIRPAPAEGARREKMKKSLSWNWSFGGRNMEEEEEIDRRRPATVRVKGSKASAAREAGAHGGGRGHDDDDDDDEEEGVDAKADKFINRFKQQLKLQRLDSLLRFRETMLNNKTPAT